MFGCRGVTPTCSKHWNFKIRPSCFLYSSTVLTETEVQDGRKLIQCLKYKTKTNIFYSLLWFYEMQTSIIKEHICAIPLQGFQHLGFHSWETTQLRKIIKVIIIHIKCPLFASFAYKLGNKWFKHSTLVAWHNLYLPLISLNQYSAVS